MKLIFITQRFRFLSSFINIQSSGKDEEYTSEDTIDEDVPSNLTYSTVYELDDSATYRVDATYSDTSKDDDYSTIDPSIDNPIDEVQNNEVNNT